MFYIPREQFEQMFRVLLSDVLDNKEQRDNLHGVIHQTEEDETWLKKHLGNISNNHNNHPYLFYLLGLFFWIIWVVLLIVLSVLLYQISKSIFHW
jgi:type VI protein secretion system component VasF